MRLSRLGLGEGGAFFTFTSTMIVGFTGVAFSRFAQN